MAYSVSGPSNDAQGRIHSSLSLMQHLVRVEETQED